MAEGSRRLDNATMATEWREVVSVTEPWRRASNQAGARGAPVEGEAGGFFVICDRWPTRRAYLKPVVRSAAFKRAAREKIASDLAYDLGVDVPPVLLATRDDAASNEERFVAVSLVLYPVQLSWEQVRSVATHFLEKSLDAREQVARAWVFDTWLDQRDHHDGSPHNIILGGSVENDLKFVFLDYAFSLGHLDHWNGHKFERCERAQFPALLRQIAPAEVIMEQVKRIEALTSGQIKEVVWRIPVSHLPDSQKEMMCQGLIDRQKRIRGAFEGLKL